MKLACTMQTSLLPLCAMGGLFYKCEGAWKEHHMCHVGNRVIETVDLKTSLDFSFLWYMG